MDITIKLSDEMVAAFDHHLRLTGERKPGDSAQIEQFAAEMARIRFRDFAAEVQVRLDSAAKDLPDDAAALIARNSRVVEAIEGQRAAKKAEAEAAKKAEAASAPKKP